MNITNYLPEVWQFALIYKLFINSLQAMKQARQPVVKMDYFLTLAGLVFIFASSAGLLSTRLYHQITRKEKTWLHH
ncbi:MAG: hypothetical protein PHN98_12650 [Smithellaceae bacterium]|nr:hypothetical protein [Smithellaceae bacterium]